MGRIQFCILKKMTRNKFSLTFKYIYMYNYIYRFYFKYRVNFQVLIFGP